MDNCKATGSVRREESHPGQGAPSLRRRQDREKKAGSFLGEGGAWAKALGRDRSGGGERRLAEVFICRAGGGLRPSSLGRKSPRQE